MARRQRAQALRTTLHHPTWPSQLRPGRGRRAYDMREVSALTSDARIRFIGLGQQKVGDPAGPAMPPGWGWGRGATGRSRGRSGLGLRFAKQRIKEVAAAGAPLVRLRGRELRKRRVRVPDREEVPHPRPRAPLTASAESAA